MRMDAVKAMRPAVAALLALIVSSCGSSVEKQNEAAPDSSYWFRAEDRPVYEKTIRVDDLASFIERGGSVLDVRLEEDYALNPVLIPGAERRDPDHIAEWASRIPKDRPVAVYCVKGRWVSQKAAAYLADRGLDAYSVEGGLEAWSARASPDRSDAAAK